VDHLADSQKQFNLHGAQFADYMDRDEFRQRIRTKSLNLSPIHAIFHEGACSNTLVDDGMYMMDNNFTYSKEVLEFALEHGAPLVYASTAAVYGLSGPGKFLPTLENEKPLNIYGFSKLTFDNYIRQRLAQEKLPISIVGLRYFNVYGPREQHKGRMASVIHHFSKQILETRRVKLFAGSGGYADGEQRRDFVYVRDLARLNMYFAQVGPYASSSKTYQAVVNAGTGHARSFNEVARALMLVHGQAHVEYMPMPADLHSRYQHFTEADLTSLRATGCDLQFTSLEDGVRETFTVAEPAPA
jgi:ADP-L-glycero-D-manno-heptose 6-epimerase